MNVGTNVVAYGIRGTIVRCLSGGRYVVSYPMVSSPNASVMSPNASVMGEAIFYRYELTPLPDAIIELPRQVYTMHPAVRRRHRRLEFDKLADLATSAFIDVRPLVRMRVEGEF